MDRSIKAKEYFKKGYNCSQSVLLSFSDLIGIGEQEALKIAAPFGGGMGRLREVCGTVSGMFLALGLIFYDAENISTESKTELYKREQELANRFRAKNGSIICRELLSGIKTDSSPIAEARTEEYYKKRPCTELCALAAEIMEEYLIEQGVLPKKEK